MSTMDIILKIVQPAVLALSLFFNVYLGLMKQELELEVSKKNIALAAQAQIEDISRALLQNNPYKAILGYANFTETLKIKNAPEDSSELVDIYRRTIINFFKERVRTLIRTVDPQVKSHPGQMVKDFIQLKFDNKDLQTEEQEIIFIIRAFETVDFTSIGNEFLDDIFYKAETRAYMSPYQVAIRHFSKGINLLLLPYEESNIKESAEHLFYANLVFDSFWNINKTRKEIADRDGNAQFQPRINNENERIQFIKRLAGELSWKGYLPLQQHRIETPKALLERIQKNNK
jgi:hypothetical protein